MTLVFLNAIHIGSIQRIFSTDFKYNFMQICLKSTIYHSVLSVNLLENFFDMVKSERHIKVSFFFNVPCPTCPVISSVQYICTCNK
jgi:hypothetical protein